MLTDIPKSEPSKEEAPNEQSKEATSKDDISYFRILYKYKMGTLVLQDNTGQPYTYKTKIDNMRTNALDVCVQNKFQITNNLFAGFYVKR